MSVTNECLMEMPCLSKEKVTREKNTLLTKLYELATTNSQMRDLARYCNINDARKKSCEVLQDELRQKCTFMNNGYKWLRLSSCLAITDFDASFLDIAKKTDKTWNAAKTDDLMYLGDHMPKYILVDTVSGEKQSMSLKHYNLVKVIAQMCANSTRGAFSNKLFMTDGFLRFKIYKHNRPFLEFVLSLHIKVRDNIERTFFPTIRKFERTSQAAFNSKFSQYADLIATPLRQKYQDTPEGEKLWAFLNERNFSATELRKILKLIGVKSKTHLCKQELQTHFFIYCCENSFQKDTPDIEPSGFYDLFQTRAFAFGSRKEFKNRMMPKGNQTPSFGALEHPMAHYLQVRVVRPKHVQVAKLLFGNTCAFETFECNTTETPLRVFIARAERFPTMIIVFMPITDYNY